SSCDGHNRFCPLPAQLELLALPTIPRLSAALFQLVQTRGDPVVTQRYFDPRRFQVDAVDCCDSLKRCAEAVYRLPEPRPEVLAVPILIWNRFCSLRIPFQPGYTKALPYRCVPQKFHCTNLDHSSFATVLLRRA